MKKLFCLFFALLLPAFFSCKLIDDGKGTLVVRNEVGDSNIVISEVYVKVKGSSGYNRVFTGSIKSDRSHFIELEPDYYSVMIKATTTAPGTLTSTSKEYETDFNDYREIKKDKFLTVIFDVDSAGKKGIYFD